MIEAINIARNQKTVFIAIDLEKLQIEDLEEISDYIWDAYHSMLGIPAASEEEQTEIENILSSMENEDKQTAYRESLEIEI